MKQYILYGYVRDKSLRDLTEYYIKKTEGELLFYVDDNYLELARNREVRCPDIIYDHPNATIVIMVAMGYMDIYQNLRKRGINNDILIAPLLGFRFIIDNYNPPENYLHRNAEWIKKHSEELSKIFINDDQYTSDMLKEIIDERSKFEFINPNVYADFIPDVVYFHDKTVSPEGDIVFIDGGTYIGDTIEQIFRTYTDRLRFLIGFEPDERNLLEAYNIVDNLGIDERVLFINKGLWDSEKSLHFRLVGDEYSIAENGEIQAKVTSIDNHITELEPYLENGSQLCIKLDVEGSELMAIEGAKKAIELYHPYLAVCIYHKMQDILDIPNTIRRIRDDYAFYLRGGVHTEVYAVPIRRNN